MESLSPIVSQFKKYLSTSGRGLSTVNCYSTDIKHFASYITELGLDLTQAELLHLTSYARELKESKHERPNSVRRKIISIRQFYKYLFESGQIPSNPFEESIIPERKEKLPPLLSEEKRKEILAAAGDQKNPLKRTRDLAILQLLSLEGLKVSELITLRWVDFLSAEGGSSSLHIKGEKDRSILLSQEASNALKEYKKALTDSNSPELAPRKLGNIFLAFKGKDLSLQFGQITRHGLKFLLYELGTKAGTEKLNTELLRHYAINHLLETLEDLNAVKNHLGLKRAGNILKHLAKQKKEKVS